MDSEWIWAVVVFLAGCGVIAAAVKVAHIASARLDEQERQEYDRGRGDGMG